MKKTHGTHKKNNKLKIIINKSANEVFDFTLNPENTPKWISFIVSEETNEKPTRLGTIYRNQNKQGEWSEYVITAFKEDELFTMSRKNHSYHVKYTIVPLGSNKSELEYYEWVDEGDLEELFTIDILEKLKYIIESS